jgi:signal transduction histidine kinase
LAPPRHYGPEIIAAGHRTWAADDRSSPKRPGGKCSAFEEHERKKPIPGFDLLKKLLASAACLGVNPDDDEEMILQKRILLVTSLAVTASAVGWGVLYLAFDENLAASIPLSYFVISMVSIVAFARTCRFGPFRLVQILLILLLPFLLMLSLGGYVHGSAVIVWAFLAPLGALLCWNTRQAHLMFLLFVTQLIAAALLSPYLRTDNNLPEVAVIGLFILNIGVVSSMAFAAFLHFVKQKELAMRLVKERRDLERTNLEQELLLKQSEKLATLGRLSAGVAHELNNPASAVQRGAAQLKEAFSRLSGAQLRLGQLGLWDEHLQTLAELGERALEGTKKSTNLDALARSDWEDRIVSALEGAGINQGWEGAPTLVEMGFEPDSIKTLGKEFSPEHLSTALDVLTGGHEAQTLVDEIGESSDRISRIVSALKAYTYMDQAPLQFIDIHEGLDNTLVMLRGVLTDGIIVRREYAENLPDVQAYGSEMNQVWTNLIDNAVYALGGQGEIRLRTCGEGNLVVIEIADNGPGIPEEIQPHIFDPFYTTKPVGEGAGLGLNISHNIVVKQHYGELSVQSQPGDTRFIVKLPLRLEDVEG